MRRALILAVLLCSAGCSLHMSAELLNPLNKGGKTSPAASAPTPTPNEQARILESLPLMASGAF